MATGCGGFAGRLAVVITGLDEEVSAVVVAAPSYEAGEDVCATALVGRPALLQLRPRAWLCYSRPAPQQLRSASHRWIADYPSWSQPPRSSLEQLGPVERPERRFPIGSRPSPVRCRQSLDRGDAIFQLLALDAADRARGDCGLDFRDCLAAAVGRDGGVSFGLCG